MPLMLRQHIILSLVVVITALTSALNRTAIAPHRTSNGNPNCSLIGYRYCDNVNYDFAFFPNAYSHADQSAAYAHMRQYRGRCSPHLSFFICTMFMPVCTENTTVPLPPCKNMCESVKRGCEQGWSSSHLDWPMIFDCDKMPEFGDACVSEGDNHELLMPDIVSRTLPPLTTDASSTTYKYIMVIVTLALLGSLGATVAVIMWALRNRTRRRSETVGPSEGETHPMNMNLVESDSETTSEQRAK